MLRSVYVCYVCYPQTCNRSRTKSQNLNVSRLVLQLSLLNPLKPGVQSENEDVVGAAPPGNAPTTSEWSTILLPVRVRLIIEFWRYVSLQISQRWWLPMAWRPGPYLAPCPLQSWRLWLVGAYQEYHNVISNEKCICNLIAYGLFH